MRSLAPIFVILVATAMSGSVRAEEAAPPPKPLTPAEMKEKADATIANGQRLSDAVGKMLAVATESGDMLKVTCLGDKLTQIDENTKAAEGHAEAMAKATAPDVAAHQLTMIEVIAQNLNTLGQEAGQCVGQDLYETGRTTVESTMETSLIPFEKNPSLPPTILPPALPTIPPAVSGMR